MCSSFSRRARDNFNDLGRSSLNPNVEQRPIISTHELKAPKVFEVQLSTYSRPGGDDLGHEHGDKCQQPLQR